MALTNAWLQIFLYFAVPLALSSRWRCAGSTCALCGGRCFGRSWKWPRRLMKLRRRC